MSISLNRQTQICPLGCSGLMQTPCIHKLLAKKRNVQGNSEKELPPTPEQKAPTQKMSQAEELSGPLGTVTKHAFGEY